MTLLGRDCSCAILFYHVLAMEQYSCVISCLAPHIRYKECDEFVIIFSQCWFGCNYMHHLFIHSPVRPRTVRFRLLAPIMKLVSNSGSHRSLGVYGGVKDLTLPILPYSCTLILVSELLVEVIIHQQTLKAD